MDKTMKKTAALLIALAAITVLLFAQFSGGQVSPEASASVERKYRTLEDVHTYFEDNEMKFKVYDKTTCAAESIKTDEDVIICFELYEGYELKRSLNGLYATYRAMGMDVAEAYEETLMNFIGE